MIGQVMLEQIGPFVELPRCILKTKCNFVADAKPGQNFLSGKASGLEFLRDCIVSQLLI